MTIAHASTRPRRRWGRWVALALALVVLAFVGLFAWDFWQLKNASAELRTHAEGAQQAITNRDADALASEVDGAQQAAVTFANATTGVHWWVADHLPWIKNQTVPLHTAGQATLAITDGALTPLSELDNLSALQAPKIENGHIDPYILEPYGPVLADAAAVMTEQQEVLSGVSLNGTLTQIREPYLELASNLRTLGATIQGAHVAAEVLPSMLGADGPRDYLVMVQNNAEPRTTGGIPGAVIEVKVDNGTITMGRFSTANDMIDYDKIDAELTEDEERIFTGRMLMYPQDVNFTPEYPRSAYLMTQFWSQKYGETVDGVISVDPVALSYMLQGMEPTEIGGLTITAENLSSVMLNQAYLEFPDPQESDAFFALASQQLFGLLIGGGTSSVEGVERAIEEGRFMVWSGQEEEQELLATTPIAGGFLERTDTLGLFINDGSGSKIGYYIDTEVSVVNHLCTDGSLRGQTVTYTLTHTFDGDVSQLPWYISGGDLYVPAGEFHANILLYPPAGEGVTTYSQDGEQAQLTPQTHDGRGMSTARITLVPGQTTTLEYQLTAKEHGLLPPMFAGTPGPSPQETDMGVDNVGEDC
ncbi:DUF4012 domain-containing protein [Demequina sp.]|uniref:DUF4012 domain-containing protein n=1 Tax=Demequina sp. TaxID=2050685 RepID=UPI003D0ECE89